MPSGAPGASPRVCIEGGGAEPGSGSSLKGLLASVPAGSRGDGHSLGQKKGLGCGFRWVPVQVGTESSCSSGIPGGGLPSSPHIWAEGWEPRAAVSPRLPACAPSPFSQAPQPPSMVSVTSSPTREPTRPLRGPGHCDWPTCRHGASVFRRSFCFSSSHREQTPLISSPTRPLLLGCVVFRRVGLLHAVPGNAHPSRRKLFTTVPLFLLPDAFATGETEAQALREG